MSESATTEKAAAGPAVGSATETGLREKATEAFLLRLTPSRMRMLNAVYERTNVKSKQKLVESILVPELERRYRELVKSADDNV